jgi:hypothetical protein
VQSTGARDCGLTKENRWGRFAKTMDLDLGGVFSPTRDLARGADRWG